MRLEKAIFHNIGPFAHAELNLEALGEDAKLIALRGVNGAGKTFCLQTAIAGAAYRKMPTQGTLVGRAKARDSYVESHLVNGQRWVVRHDLDSVSKKGEATVKDAAGEPAYKGTSVKLFDAWSAKHFTAQDVLFATSFAVQKSGGFVDLISADRISVILQVVGVSRLERMAKRAREKASAARHEFEKLDARLIDERARSGDLEALQRALGDARHSCAETTETALEAARIALDLALDEAKESEAKAKAYAAAVEKREQLNVALGSQQEATAKLELRIRNNRAILAEAEAIHAARAELDVLAELDGTLALDLADVSKPFDVVAAGIVAELAAQQSVVLKAEALVMAAKAKLEAADAAAQIATARIARARARLVDEESVNGAEAEAHRLGWLVAERKAAADKAEQDLAEQRGLTLANADGRIRGLRVGLEFVRDVDGERLDEAPGIARKVLANDDSDVARAVEVPARISDLEGQLARERAEHRKLESALSTAERLAARAPEIAAARVELASAIAADEVSKKARGEAQSSLEDVTVDRDIERNTLDGIKERKTAEEQRRAELEPPARSAIEANQASARNRRLDLVPLAEKYPHLIAADARLAELEPQLVAARSELARLEKEDSATPAPTVPPAAPDVAAFRASLERAEREARSAQAAVAVAEQRLITAQESHARLVALQVEVDLAAAELADWNLLAADFGRDGVQSAEVDSAGPELTALTNDLLHHCHGSQFTVSIETSRLSSDGKDQIDECRVQVIDAIDGREGEAREFSGGQSVIIGEACSLALTMLACQRAGITGITLVRDESGAALDPQAGRAYIKMLRRAADFVGASRTLLVTHSDECAHMCDARIQIENGTFSYAA